MGAVQVGIASELQVVYARNATNWKDDAFCHYLSV